MEYHVPCPCGKRLPVKADQAGTTIVCDCGCAVTVPSLSKLRTATGLGAYESGAIDTIRRMLDEGTLPWGETCAESGLPTRDVIVLAVQCERSYAAQDHHRITLLAVLLFGFWPLLLSLGAKARREPHGRDTVVKVPLRLRREFHGRLAGWGSQRRLRRLLRTVPVYDRLLEEYPKATVRVDGSRIEHKPDATWAELDSPIT